MPDGSSTTPVWVNEPVNNLRGGPHTVRNGPRAARQALRNRAASPPREPRHANCVFCIMEDVNDPTQEAGPAAADYHDGASRHEEGRNGGRRNGTDRAASGGVQSIERAFDLLEMLADAGGALGLSELSTVSGPPAAHCSPADAHAGQPGLRPAGGLPAVHAGLATDPARRDLQPHAGDVAAAVPGPVGPAHRGDRQPGHARRRRGRLHRAGAQPALDADVHRARPPGPTALHRGRQGPARPDPGRRRHVRCSSGTACPPTPQPRSPTRTCCSRTSR